MPLYLFQHPETQEVKEVFLTMKEEPEKYQFQIDEFGIKWKRIFTIPQASINSTPADPYSVKDFNRRLDGKNVTFGDMWDASAEASQARADKEGIDPVKQAYYDKYASERNGTRHPSEVKEKTQKELNQISKDIKLALNV